MRYGLEPRSGSHSGQWSTERSARYPVALKGVFVANTAKSTLFQAHFCSGRRKENQASPMSTEFWSDHIYPRGRQPQAIVSRSRERSVAVSQQQNGWRAAAGWLGSHVLKTFACIHNVAVGVLLGHNRLSHSPD